jgi:hypothetical protein
MILLDSSAQTSPHSRGVVRPLLADVNVYGQSVSFGARKMRGAGRFGRDTLSYVCHLARRFVVGFQINAAKSGPTATHRSNRRPSEEWGRALTTALRSLGVMLRNLEGGHRSPNIGPEASALMCRSSKFGTKA